MGLHHATHANFGFPAHLFFFFADGAAETVAKAQIFDFFAFDLLQLLRLNNAFSLLRFTKTQLAVVCVGNRAEGLQVFKGFEWGIIFTTIVSFDHDRCVLTKAAVRANFASETDRVTGHHIIGDVVRNRTVPAEVVASGSPLVFGAWAVKLVPLAATLIHQPDVMKSPPGENKCSAGRRFNKLQALVNFVAWDSPIDADLCNGLRLGLRLIAPRD